jgi:hypothetical protein
LTQRFGLAKLQKLELIQEVKLDWFLVSGLGAFSHVYEVRPRKDHRGVNLISDALPFGRLLYGEPNAVGNAVDYAMHRSRSHDAVIRVYDAAGNVIQTRFSRMVRFARLTATFPRAATPKAVLPWPVILWIGLRRFRRKL